MRNCRLVLSIGILIVVCGCALQHEGAGDALRDHHIAAISVSVADGVELPSLRQRAGKEEAAASTRIAVIIEKAVRARTVGTHSGPRPAKMSIELQELHIATFAEELMRGRVTSELTAIVEISDVRSGEVLARGSIAGEHTEEPGNDDAGFDFLGLGTAITALLLAPVAAMLDSPPTEADVRAVADDFAGNLEDWLQG